MTQVSITAEPRSEFGKGAARRIRRAGKIPAVIYGHDQDVRHVALPGHELTQALRKVGLILDVELEGKHILVAPRDVQRDPVRRILEHVDLVIVTVAEAKAFTDAADAAVVAAEVEQAEASAMGTGAPEAAEAATEAEGTEESADESAADADADAATAEADAEATDASADA
ncbi:MAG: 50S ribosomal protein L25 [Actinomycetes bacterium]